MSTREKERIVLMVEKGVAADLAELAGGERKRGEYVSEIVKRKIEEKREHETQKKLLEKLELLAELIEKGESLADSQDNNASTEIKKI